MVPGGLSGTWGYRAELVGQGRRLLALASMSGLGGLAGALLLLALPESAFGSIVPVLLAAAVVLVVLQPWVQRALAERRRGHEETSGFGRTLTAMVGVALAGVYGGYFGGAQGVLLVGLLGTVLVEPLQRINGIKNALASTVNAVAAVIFLLVAPEQVDWPVVALIAAGSASGGVIGAKLGRRLPAPALRYVVVVVGLVAITFLLGS
jgi:uncharacterized protein